MGDNLSIGDIVNLNELVVPNMSQLNLVVSSGVHPMTWGKS